MLNESPPGGETDKKPYTSGKIVQLTSAHGPSDPRIYHKHCKALAGAGFDVVMIAPTSDYKVPRLTTPEGVTVVYVRRESDRLKRVSKTLWALYRAATAEDADIYHLHDPELIPIGTLLKARGKTVFYDVHEDLPASIEDKHWISAPLRHLTAMLARMLELSGAWMFDRVVSATPTIARNFPAKKTITVQNFPADDFLYPARKNYCDREPLVIYLGSIQKVRGIMELLDSMTMLPESLGVRLLLCGNIETPELEAQMRQHPFWSKVEYHRWQPQPGVKRLMARARVGIVTLNPSPRFMASQPLKLFEYMAAELPVVASDFPLWRQMIGSANCGEFVDAGKPTEIANAIRRLIENPEEAEQMGKRGRNLALKKYMWASEAEKLIRMYHEFCAPVSTAQAPICVESSGKSLPPFSF